MRGLVIIVLIILIVCLCIHSLMPTDTYTYIVNDNTFEPYANTTVKDITEERVQNDINEIRKYQQLFGFSNKCKQGNYALSAHTQWRNQTIATNVTMHTPIQAI